MTRDEIERYLNTGRARSVCVDRSLSAEYPGYVRTVTISAGDRVSIELNSYGEDEGGPTFEASFTSLEAAIAALEAYLRSPLTDWVNYSSRGSYPEPASLTPASIEAGHQKLIEAIRSGSMLLPDGNFRLADDGFWSRYLPTGGAQS
ncbi:MAG TPA: hypothetical protein VIA18_06080 [Polyangia bacterium]|nr:hypothetical protein [Polyangia bacterium]